MPIFLAIALASGLGGMFVGSQIDNAVQSKAAAPVIVDESKQPWWVQYVIIGIVLLVIWNVVGKKLLK